MTLNPKKSADRYVILVICHIGQQNVTGRSNVDVSSCGAVLLNANYVPKSTPSQLVDEKKIDNVLVLNSTYSSACTWFSLLLFVLLHSGKISSR